MQPVGIQEIGFSLVSAELLFQFCSCACFPQLLLVIPSASISTASVSSGCDLTAVFFVGYDSHARLCRLLVDFAMAEQLVEWFGTLKFNSVSLGSKSLFAYFLGLFSAVLRSAPRSHLYCNITHWFALDLSRIRQKT